jgi:dihydrofolate reductase/thymidylate synthase
MKFSIIVCVDSQNGIGKDGCIPWKITEDMRHFKNITTTVPSGKKNVVIMGRNTWESIPNNFLKDRINIVLSTTLDSVNLVSNVKDSNNDLNLCKDLDLAIEYISDRNRLSNDINEVFIIGGQRLYEDSINNVLFSTIYMTRLFKTFNCDRVFPLVPDNFKVTMESDMYNNSVSNYKFMVYIRENRDELQLNKLISKILVEGEVRETRNAVVRSIFSHNLTFDISKSFPLMTCKRVWFKGVFEELIWFIRGDIDSKLLERKGVNIWKGNTTREYLNSIELNDLPEGNCGCVYGYQWRNFNAPFTGSSERGNGVDQLQNVVDLLRNNPESRRIFMSAWNPSQLDEMCLPPCHISYQFYVSNGCLSCQMYQRSSDVFLGLYFNIASTALLTYLLAKITGLTPHKIHICLGDTHIYDAHVEQCQEILKRDTRSLPVLKINKDICELSDIEEMVYSDIDILGYNPHPCIKAEMY